MTQKVKCPVCGQQGVLMWKNTTTFAKGHMYRYRKLYVYHNKTHGQKWCYLKPEQIKALGDTTQKATQNTAIKN
ncbi:MAG: hypothetical protein ABSB28_11415 [Candidatus Bathyarchaeia archaeon]